jgi:stage II sporulation protein D
MHFLRRSISPLFCCTVFLSLAVLVSLSCAESEELIIDPEAAAAAWYQGDRTTGVEIYRRLLAEQPDNDDLRLSLVVLLREEGDIQESLRYSAELTGPEAVEHEMNLALAGVAAGDDDDSVGDDVSRFHFWRGVRLVLGERYSRGTHHFTRALETAEGAHFPYAHYALGRLAAGRGDFEAARAAYQRALGQDRNLTEVFVPLARAHWHLGDYRAAWDQLERARIALPWNMTIPALIAEWEEERPALTADSEARNAARRAAAIPPRVAAVATAATDQYREEEVLRVGLVENLDSVYLKTGGPFLLTAAGEVVYESADTDEPVVLRVRSRGPEIAVTAENGRELYRGTEAVRLGYHSRTYTTTIFDMTYGHGQFSSGREDRSYRGEIEILLRGEVFTVINRLSVEEYLYSVVPSEMPAWWPPAALEAQAIAARSYTLHPRNRYGERGFDLLSSVTSAYYPGVTNEHSRTTAAVNATRGLVLQDGRRPLDAVYSANHAGYAEAAGSVWGWPSSLVVTSDPLLPALESHRSPAEVYRWLVSQPDSYSGRPPYAGRSSYRWDLLVPRETIEQRLADSGQSVGRVERISPGPRGITGRVESVTIHGSAGETVVRRDAIRSRLGGLRSNLFVVSAYTGPGLRDDSPGEGQTEAPGYFYFQGAGWGHGVGLDQTGAAGMAEAGFDAESILNHYYPENEIVRWY